MTAYECGVCWSVYDPAEGDPVWQVPAGTPFSELPEHWRCPKCDAPKEKFLARTPPPASTRDRLLSAYGAVLPRMVGLPITNPRLPGVIVSDVVALDGGELAVVMTPWSLLAVFVPPTGTTAPQGTSVTKTLPSGSYDFVAGTLEGMGELWSLSLLSPVLEFDGPEAAAVAVKAAFDELRQAPPESSRAPAMTSRRALFSLSLTPEIR